MSDKSEMQALLEMMQSMKDQMEAQSKELHQLKTAQPEGPIDTSELAKRQEQHNKILHKLVEAQAAQIRNTFGYSEKSDFIPASFREPTDTNVDLYRDILMQMCWTIANTSARQYLYARYRSDGEYLKMHQSQQRMGVTSMAEVQGVQPLIMENIDPNADNTQSERVYQYYFNQMLPYEVSYHAAMSIWNEIVEEKRDEQMKAGGMFRDPNPPRYHVSEQAYAAYVEEIGNVREQQRHRERAEALNNARMLRMTQLSTNE